MKKCIEAAAQKALQEYQETSKEDSIVPSTTPPSGQVMQHVQGGTVNNQIINIHIHGDMNINNGVQVNGLHINGFGKEDLSHILEPEYLDDRLKELNGGGVFQIVRDVHFNKEKPENRNVRLGSLKRKTLKVKEDDGWHVKANDDVLDALINRYKKILLRRSHEPGFKKTLQHESDFMQIQQDLINFTKTSNPTAYYKCAHKILALIEDLERATAAPALTS